MALGRELRTLAQVNTEMFLPTADTLYFAYAMPGWRIVAAAEGPGDLNGPHMLLYVAGHDEDARTAFLVLTAER